ncbi:MAG TPA: hypothetical protein VMC79_16325, partial [Rectinemataceae bacterium]|nr:hypothetical protein [Rectinemataceae bacterium]
MGDVSILAGPPLFSLSEVILLVSIGGTSHDQEEVVNRKLIAVFALVALVAAGASAQLALGITGAAYGDTTARDAFANLRDGNGVFYGPFVELGLGTLALGLSGNFSFYEQNMSYDPNQTFMVKMVDYDVSAYVQ